MRIITYIFFLFIVVLGVTFAGLNANPVSVNYYIGSVQLPLSLLLAITWVVGCLLGLVVGLVFYFKTKISNSRLRQRLKIVEQEVVNLRAMPLKDDH